MRGTRQVTLFAALAICGAWVPAFGQEFQGSPYRDPQGRFSFVIPLGWTASPLGDSVETKHGDSVITILVSEGRQEPRALLLSLGGQIARQWRDFRDTETVNVTTLAGQPAVSGVFAGVNPKGVDSLLNIMTTTNGARSFALIMSVPTSQSLMGMGAFLGVELSFTIGNGPGAPIANSPAPANRPAPVAAAGAPLDRAVPPGFVLTRDSQGTGRLLVGSFSGNMRSATVTAQGMLGSLRGYFDDVPAIATAARNDRDTQVQALFSAKMQGIPVVGIIGIEIKGGNGDVVLIYDRAGSLRDSYLRLRGKPVPPLQSTGLADGSTIGIPQGWRVVASVKGAVDVGGPNGEMISLGIALPVYSQAPPVLNIPGMPANSLLTGPCCDPVRAMMAITPQISAVAEKNGGESIQLVRVLDSKPTESPVNGGQAAFIFADLNIGGRPSQQFSWVMAAPTGYGQWVYYSSSVTAPAAVFTSQVPTLLAIWNSYSTNPGVFAERMDNAIKSMNQATASVLSAARESSRVREAASERWDQVIRGVDTIQNTRTGRTYQVDNAAARDLVNGLNASGNGNWKVLTLDELVPKR